MDRSEGYPTSMPGDWREALLNSEACSRCPPLPSVPPQFLTIVRPFSVVASIETKLSAASTRPCVPTCLQRRPKSSRPPHALRGFHAADPNNDKKTRIASPEYPALHCVRRVRVSTVRAWLRRLKKVQALLTYLGELLLLIEGDVRQR